MHDHASEPRITLSDVAALAGVSRTTASFVMSGRRDMRISEKSTARVLQAARELNYRPNLLARSLRSNLTQTIGFISDVIATESFAGEAVRGSVSTALLREHLLVVGETEGDAEVEKQLVNGMLDRGVGGFVYASMYTRLAKPVAVLREHPLVLMNCTTRGRKLPSVMPDDRSAGRAAARAILDAGHHSDIYLVGESPLHVLAAKSRRVGIEEELASAGVTLAGSVETRWWPNPAFDALNALLSEGVRPKALICLNDRVAMGAYQALAVHRLRVPTDVSVVSFDGSDLSNWLHPSLTSVVLPHFEMGRLAVEMLLSPESKPTIHLVPMPLRLGESIAAPKKTRRRPVTS